MLTTPNVEATLTSFTASSLGEWRIANCNVQFTTIDYLIAKEVSPRVAEILYRLDGASTFVPREEIRQVKFEGLNFPPQRMEFRNVATVPIPGGIIPGVEIRHLQALRLKGSTDFILQANLRLRFMARERSAVSSFLWDYLDQTVFLTFSPMQRPLLPLIERSDFDDTGAFVNDRAKAARATMQQQQRSVQ